VVNVRRVSKQKKKSQQQNFAKRSKNINLIVDVYVLFKCPAIHRGTQLFLRGPLNTRESRFTPKKNITVYWIICFSSTSNVHSHSSPLLVIPSLAHRSQKKKIVTSWRNVSKMYAAMILAFVGVREFFELSSKKNAVMPFAL
jgi:hypothetical protein